jgi:hypothetical protein
MSRIRIVGGTITKTTEGAHHMYSEENIVFNSSKAITEVGEKNGIVYGKPKDAPPAPLLKKYFVEGWWSSDEAGNKRIKEALVGDHVYFHIKTKDIPNGGIVQMKLYDDDNNEKNEPKEKGKKDHDDFKKMINTQTNQEVASGTVKDNKIVKSIMLENFESFIKDEADKQIELYYRCSYKTENVEFPRTPSDYLKVKQYKKAVTFYIGGAGDKTPFLGVGPNENINYVKILVDRKIKSTKFKFDYSSHWLGFDEVYGDVNIKKGVLDQIHDKRASIYIIGHSLGGWNAAHLSKILSDKGYKVKMLITIDPVGMDAIVNGSSKMYWKTPKPKADFWINIFVDPKNYNFPDFIADMGNQWKPDVNSPNVFHTTSISHENADGIFIEKTSTGKSAFDYMIDSVTTNLE